MSQRFGKLEFTDPSRQVTSEASAGPGQAPAGRAAISGYGSHESAANLGEPRRGAQWHLDQALRLASRGLFEPALQAYTRTLREDRTRLVAWVGQVQMLIELGEHAEARTWADKALEVFRGNGELLASKAVSCVRMGDQRPARAASDQSMASAGTSAYRWVARGEVLLAMGDRPWRECFEKGLAEPDADWTHRVMIARACQTHRRPALACEFSSLATRAAPGEPFAWVTHARSLVGVGNDADARVAIRHALELDPRYTPGRALLSELGDTTLGRRWSRRLKGWLRR